MKKIINAPETFIPEMLEGIYAAHPDELMCVEGDLHCLVSKRKHAGKVGIATGGGSGHLPLFLGYVGEGMLDGCSIGDVFQSPSAEQMLAVTKARACSTSTETITAIFSTSIWQPKWRIWKRISAWKASSQVRTSPPPRLPPTASRITAAAWRASSSCINARALLPRQD